MDSTKAPSRRDTFRRRKERGVQSPLEIYLRAINDFPLLDRDKEAALSHFRDRSRELMSGAFADMVQGAYDRHLIAEHTQNHEGPFRLAIKAIKDRIVELYEQGTVQMRQEDPERDPEVMLAFFIDRAHKRSSDDSGKVNPKMPFLEVAKIDDETEKNISQIIETAAKDVLHYVGQGSGIPLKGLEPSDRAGRRIARTAMNALRSIQSLNERISTCGDLSVGALSFLAHFASQECIKALERAGDRATLEQIRGIEKSLADEMLADGRLREYLLDLLKTGRLQRIDLWTARSIMTQANLRLVVNIARAYTGKGLGLQDLIEEGNIGLMRSVESFDPRHPKMPKMSTYCSCWIKQNMKRALVNTGRTIRIPAYMSELLVKWRRAAAALHDELKRQPTKQEIAKKLNLPKKKLAIIERALGACNVNQTGRTGPDEFPMEEMIADPSVVSTDAIIDDPENIEQLFAILQTLDSRESEVIRRRFALTDDGEERPEEETLWKIGEDLNLTRERVRQIEGEALVKLRDRLEEAGQFPVKMKNGSPQSEDEEPANPYPHPVGTPPAPRVNIVRTLAPNGTSFDIAETNGTHIGEETPERTLKDVAMPKHRYVTPEEIFTAMQEINDASKWGSDEIVLRKILEEKGIHLVMFRQWTKHYDIIARARARGDATVVFPAPAKADREKDVRKVKSKPIRRFRHASDERRAMELERRRSSTGVSEYQPTPVSAPKPVQNSSVVVAGTPVPQPTPPVAQKNDAVPPSLPPPVLKPQKRLPDLAQCGAAPPRVAPKPAEPPIVATPLPPNLPKDVRVDDESPPTMPPHVEPSVVPEPAIAVAKPAPVENGTLSMMDRMRAILAAAKKTNDRVK